MQAAAAALAHADRLTNVGVAKLQPPLRSSTALSNGLPQWPDAPEQTPLLQTNLAGLDVPYSEHGCVALPGGAGEGGGEGGGEGDGGPDGSSFVSAGAMTLTARYS